MLTPTDFRSLDSVLSPQNIRNKRMMTLILVKQDGYMTYATNRGNKDSLIAKYKPDDGDVLLMAWTGEWSTDIFLITKEDLNKHYELNVYGAS